MKTILALILCLFVVVLSVPAEAKIFVWNDPDGQIRLSYPDHWLRQAQLNPEEMLVISHPQYQDMASCTLRKVERLNPALNPQTILNDALRLGYRSVSVIDHRDTIGWATRAATLTHLSYSMQVNDQNYAMKAVEYATHMDGILYNLHCAARAENFDYYSSLFWGIAISTKSPITRTPFANGYYRNFTHEHIYLFVNKERTAYMKF